MINRARRFEVGSIPTDAEALASPSSGAAASVWVDTGEALSLVLDAARFEAMFAEAATWADRIVVCVTAPQSQRGVMPLWSELLARSSKCERVLVRRADQTEGWLLHQLYETGALRLVDVGGRQVASNLVMFSREGELRVLLSHMPFERALAGAPYGTLLAFRGNQDDDFARSCRAQRSSWVKRGRIPTGAEIDVLALGARAELPAFAWPESFSVVVEPARLEAGLRGLLGEELAFEAVGSGFRVGVSGAAGTSWDLTLAAGRAWASGNALLLEGSDGRALLVWRGGLLGPSQTKNELLWSEARLAQTALPSELLGSAEHVALVAASGSPLAPQLRAFVAEHSRLADVFGAAPPPVLGVAPFAELSPKQQLPLLWRALIGAGPLPPERAVERAAHTLRNQGYFSAEDAWPGSAVCAIIAERLEEGVQRGGTFERTPAGELCAVQADGSTYVADDWLECLLSVLPPERVLPRDTVLQLAFEHARRARGLWSEGALPNGPVLRALSGVLMSALARGLLVRVGAGGVARACSLERLPPIAPVAAGDVGESLIAVWTAALRELPALERLVLARRAGTLGAGESLEVLAERLGFPLERVRSLERDAWQRVAALTPLAATLESRLTRALGGARAVAVHHLVADDAWWQGIEQRGALAQLLFELALGGRVHRVTVAGAPRAVFFAHFTQADVDRVERELIARATEVAMPAPLAAFEPLLVAAAAELDPALAESLREALASRLSLDDSGQVQAFLPQPRRAEESVPFQPFAAGSELRLRLDDAIATTFRIARTPLSRAAIAARVQKRVDVDDATLAARLVGAPFVQLGPDEFGLVARDVPGGHDVIARVLEAITSELERAERALDAEAVRAIVRREGGEAWSDELVRSLLGSDPTLVLAPSGQVSLRAWGAIDFSRYVVCPPRVPESSRPSVCRWLEEPLDKPELLVRRLRAVLARLERAVDAEDFVSASLARQLCDLYERLTLESVKRPPALATLAQAAVRSFLERVEGDEDEPEIESIERATLLELREVLLVVLDRFELDWL